MKTARAAVLAQFNAPLELREYALPETLPPGAILVRTEMAGICGTDVHIWREEMRVQLPLIPGHETVGRIVALGSEPRLDWTGKPLKIGDRLAWNSTTSCGTCFYCKDKNQPTRCPHRRAYGIGYRCDEAPHFLGGYADYHNLLPGATVFALPDDLPTEALIGAGCALITAIHGLERAKVIPGDVVVVQGAGPVGISSLAVAKAAGAAKIIVVGGPAHRLEIAKRFGADEVVDIGVVKDASERLRIVRDFAGGYGADLVVECVGAPPAFAEGVEMCRDGGCYLVLGHYCDAGTVTFNPHVITRKQLEIHGSWSSEPRHLQAAIEFLRNNRTRFPFAEMVTHRFPLERAFEALQTTARWECGKAVLIP